MRVSVACLMLVMLASCSTTRVDRVISETFEALPCSDSFMCELDERIKILERSRVVTGGVALNIAGSLKPGCARNNGNYLCVTRRYVYETPLEMKSNSSELFNTLIDGYSSRRVTATPSSCDIITTEVIADTNFQAVDQYYNLAIVDPKTINVLDRTGGALEDYTIATLRCVKDCAYNLENNEWSNNILLLLSETRTSGRLATAEKRSRALAIKKVLSNCNPEST